jgi:hypothetical protein
VFVAAPAVPKAGLSVDWPNARRALIRWVLRPVRVIGEWPRYGWAIPVW